MIVKRLAAAKGHGRKKFFSSDNLLALIFMIVVLSCALAQGYYMFAYISMGIIVGRVGQIIFELKCDLFDKPFFHFILFIAIPAEILWNTFK